MSATTFFGRLRTVEGVVQQIDLLNREVVVLACGAARRFDVPPDCAVYLSGERVKLRLLQARDRVRVVYAERGEALVASSLRVGWFAAAGESGVVAP